MPEVRHRSAKRNQKTPSRLGVFLRQYRFEIIWAAVVALGVFLVFERMNIRRTVLQWLGAVAAALLHRAGHVGEAVAAFLARTTLSDAVGYALILGALVALLLRVRWRLMRSPRATALRCPACSGEIHRVHRSRLDHALSGFVPVQRYRCANRVCRWEGLRVVAPKTAATDIRAAAES